MPIIEFFTRTKQIQFKSIRTFFHINKNRIVSAIRENCVILSETHWFLLDVKKNNRKYVLNHIRLPGGVFDSSVSKWYWINYRDFLVLRLVCFYVQYTYIINTDITWFRHVAMLVFFSLFKTCRKHLKFNFPRNLIAKIFMKFSPAKDRNIFPMMKTIFCWKQCMLENIWSIATCV